MLLIPAAAVIMQWGLTMAAHYSVCSMCKYMHEAGITHSLSIIYLQSVSGLAWSVIKNGAQTPTQTQHTLTYTL